MDWMETKREKERERERERERESTGKRNGWGRDELLLPLAA
jgi:hypothetical protein